jgi:hypothetical protein
VKTDERLVAEMKKSEDELSEALKEKITEIFVREKDQNETVPEPVTVGVLMALSSYMVKVIGSTKMTEEQMAAWFGNMIEDVRETRAHVKKVMEGRKRNPLN